jgi:hypothetical protein
VRAKKLIHVSNMTGFAQEANMADGKDLSQGGAKDESAELEPGSDPALDGQNRQAVKNQGKATPDDYPDHHEQG